jgi:ubiquitin-conjugating enzyme E2 D/E
MRRIRKEWQIAQQNPIPGITAQPIGESDDDMLNWTGCMIGPEGSPYQGGTFNVNILLPDDYPFSPPRCRFTTKLYHPNISPEAFHAIDCPEGGRIHIDILRDGWQPCLTITRILLSIQSLLTDPNPHESMNGEAGDMLLAHRVDEYNRTVQDWVQLYAQPAPFKTCCVVHSSAAWPAYSTKQIRALNLVLSAAAACTIFGARGSFLYPPVHAGTTLSQRSLDLSLLRLLLRSDNKQRLQLMCCSCPLTTLARRLAAAFSFDDERRRVIRSIMMRYFSKQMRQ